MTANETAAYGPFTPPTPSELASLFPNFEVLDLIGAGGMGAVYKARHRGLDRLVAVKVLPQRDDPAFAERFTREARTLAKLSHPGIVAIHDFGQAGGLTYFVMEYVEGVNLRQAIRAGTLTPAETLAIISQICAALQYAHEAGVVHRDIKPENILLDARGLVKVADFGLAKLLKGGTGINPLTVVDQVLGTVHYMAPEQWEAPAAVDHRADIYSLGVVFYELLTGELPLGRFPPPSERVRIDVRLDEIVLRTLEKEPERRYQHASDVEADVEKVAELPEVTPTVEEVSIESQAVAHGPDTAPMDGHAGTANAPQTVLILDETRYLPHRVGCAVATAPLLLFPILHCSGHPKTAFGALGASLLVTLIADNLKQRWQALYLGHRVVYEEGTGPFDVQKLFIDGVRAVSSRTFRRIELVAHIPCGAGAGDQIIAVPNRIFLRTRLRLIAQRFDATLLATNTSDANRSSFRVPLALLLAAAGVIGMACLLFVMYSARWSDVERLEGLELRFGYPDHWLTLDSTEGSVRFQFQAARWSLAYGLFGLAALTLAKRIWSRNRARHRRLLTPPGGLPFHGRGENLRRTTA